MKESGINKRASITNIVYGAIIAAVYVALTLAYAPISFAAIQFRVSEVLCILPMYTPAAIPGLFIGCLMANILGGAPPVDIIGGSIATLIGAYGTYVLRNRGFIATFPPIIANALIIPFVLRYAYGAPDMIIFMMLTVGIGEVISIGVLGNLLRLALDKYKSVLFKHSNI